MAISIFDGILIALSLVMLLPIGMFCLEVLLSLWPRQARTIVDNADVRAAVLIPAHNEEIGIRATLESIMPTVGPRDRVIVVADNCSDSTAEVASSLGAEVICRTDTVRRGKGFALDFGIAHLSSAAPDVVVILDADCFVQPQTIRTLATVAASLQRPVQGLYLCDAGANSTHWEAISSLAFRFKNLVRSLGLDRLAGLCYLTGSGMALPWKHVRRAEVATANVVEDMQLGIDLAVAGTPPVLCMDALIHSPLPMQQSAARTQRTRWEHGHLATLLNQSPRLAMKGIRLARLDLMWLAIDLAIPPLSLLVLSWMVAWCLAAVVAAVGLSVWPLVLFSMAGALLCSSVFLGWLVHCREQVKLSSLLTAPLYAASKLPIYLAFLVKRQQVWVRTERDVVSR